MGYPTLLNNPDFLRWGSMCAEERRKKWAHQRRGFNLKPGDTNSTLWDGGPLLNLLTGQPYGGVLVSYIHPDAVLNDRTSPPQVDPAAVPGGDTTGVVIAIRCGEPDSAGRGAGVSTRLVRLGMGETLPLGLGRYTWSSVERYYQESTDPGILRLTWTDQVTGMSLESRDLPSPVFNWAGPGASSAYFVPEGAKSCSVYVAGGGSITWVSDENPAGQFTAPVPVAGYSTDLPVEGGSFILSAGCQVRFRLWGV